MKRISYILLLVYISLLSFCTLNENTTSEGNNLDTPDWSEETHGNNHDPNYDIVFTEDEVNRFDIEISADDWQAMLDDMTVKYGAFGSRSRNMPDANSENPIFVPCSLFFEGKEWYKVGIRFKGNSSLISAWGSGISKLALKLDFNEYEDDYPKLAGQRFYGFRQLSLSNSFNDLSFLRERVVPEIFRAMGVKAPRTAFYRVYINHGSGSIYFGLYTVVEVVDDSMLKDQFGSESGNCYKPDGAGASFKEGSFDQSYFVKTNNTEEEDWSDIEALYSKLHSANRNSDPELWRNQLQSVFYVDGFLRWLAVNTVIQNWDTYGRMTHNYYLYNDQTGSSLTWIPWDNNEALQEGKQGGALSLGLTEVGANWPLIRYLMSDPIYKALYLNYLHEVIATAFYPSKMAVRYRELHDLAKPYVTGVDGEKANYTFLNSAADFESAYNYLLNHVNSRYSATQNYLNQQ